MTEAEKKDLKQPSETNSTLTADEQTAAGTSTNTTAVDTADDGADGTSNDADTKESAEAVDSDSAENSFVEDSENEDTTAGITDENVAESKEKTDPKTAGEAGTDVGEKDAAKDLDEKSSDEKKADEKKSKSGDKSTSHKLGDPARSGNPARRRAVIEKARAKEEKKAARASRRNIPTPDADRPSWADGVALSPKWWAPTFITLLILGLVWIVVYYFSAAEYPIPGLGTWNLVIGLGLMLVGFLMTLKWR